MKVLKSETTNNGIKKLNCIIVFGHYTSNGFHQKGKKTISKALGSAPFLTSGKKFYQLLHL